MRFKIFGTVLVVAAVIIGIGVYMNPSDPEAFFTGLVTAEPARALVTTPVESAIMRGQETVDVIVWFKGFEGTMAAYAQQEQQVMALSDQVIAMYGGQRYTTLPLFGATAMTLPSENMFKIAALSSIDAIDEDILIRVTGGGGHLSITQLTEVVGIEPLWELGRGENIDVYYLDSGGSPTLGLASMTSVTDASPLDEYGHGTSVGYMIVQLSPAADVHSIRVLDRWGSGQLSTVMKGLEKAAQDGADIVNMSLGAPATSWDSLSRACEMVRLAYGVDIFAAAGNTGSVELSPSVSSEVVGVGAVNENLNLTDYSARSFDIVAPGDVISYWGDTQKEVSGTSYSSPIAAAVWANYLSGNPEADPAGTDEIATLLAGSSETSEGYLLVSGGVLVMTEPVPEPSLLEKLWHWIALFSVTLAIGVALVVKGRESPRQHT